MVLEHFEKVFNYSIQRNIFLMKFLIFSKIIIYVCMSYTYIKEPLVEVFLVHVGLIIFCILSETLLN